MQGAERLERTKVVERDIIVNDVNVHVKSIFIGQTTLEKALCNIVSRKISESRAKAELSA